MRKFDSDISLPGTEDETGKTLGDYLLLVQKYWIVITVTVLLGAGGSVLYTLKQPKIYEAVASIIIDPQPPQVFGNHQEVITLGTGSFWSNKEYYNTQVEVLEGFDLAEKTIATNNLADKPALVPQDVPKDRRLEAAATTFVQGLTVSHKNDSRVVDIRVRLADPELPVELANLHVKTFLAYTVGLRTGGTGEVSKFLAAEVDRAEKRLRAAERDLLQFRKDNNLLSVSLEETQNLLAKDLAHYSTALSEVTVKRTELGAALERAQALLEEDVMSSPIFALMNSSGAVELKQQYSVESRKLREMEQELGLGPKHPEYVGQQKQVDAIVSSLRREAQRTVREMNEQHQALRATERQFQAKLESLKEQGMDLQPKTVEYTRLKHKQTTAAEGYDLLLRRLQSSDRSGRNEAINIHSHAVARQAIQVSPRLAVNVAAATTLSLLLGLLFALGLDRMDRTVKTTEQLEALVHAPVLGVIPIVAENSHSRADAQMTKTRDLHVFENPQSPAAECCRSIRTNILFAGAERRMKTLTVSSPRPREGKSTTTIYLGTTMAQSGQRVLLVDADLRRPRLHRALDVQRDVGLTTVLLGEATLDEAIQPTAVPNLFILPAGPQPPNPAELLLTSRFQKLLEQLEQKFDRVLLDSPPLLAVSDPVVLSRLSDGVILVTQAGQTRIEDVQLGTRSLRDVDATVVGVILNDVDLDDRRYGYGSRYYTYGYGEEAKPSSAA